MATFSWATPSNWTAGFGSSDLNNLANGSVALSSLSAPQINTTSTKELYVQLEFIGGSISPSGPADVVAILLPRNSADSAYVDGEAGSTVVNQPVWMQYPHAVLGLRTKASSAQAVKSSPILLAPDKYQLGLLNRAGVTLASSGNQVNWRLLTEASS